MEQKGPFLDSFGQQHCFAVSQLAEETLCQGMAEVKGEAAWDLRLINSLPWNMAQNAVVCLCLIPSTVLLCVLCPFFGRNGRIFWVLQDISFIRGYADSNHQTMACKLVGNCQRDAHSKKEGASWGTVGFRWWQVSELFRGNDSTKIAPLRHGASQSL